MTLIPMKFPYQLRMAGRGLGCDSPDPPPGRLLARLDPWDFFACGTGRVSPCRSWLELIGPPPCGPKAETSTRRGDRSIGERTCPKNFPLGIRLNCLPVR